MVTNFDTTIGVCTTPKIQVPWISHTMFLSLRSPCTQIYKEFFLILKNSVIKAATFRIGGYSWFAARWNWPFLCFIFVSFYFSLQENITNTGLRKFFPNWKNKCCIIRHAESWNEPNGKGRVRYTLVHAEVCPIKPGESKLIRTPVYLSFRNEIWSLP